MREAPSTHLAMRRAEPAEAIEMVRTRYPFSPYRDVRGKPYRQVLACQASRELPLSADPPRGGSTY